VYLICNFCNKKIKLNLKIAAEDIFDDYNQQIENQQAQTSWNYTLDSKKDLLDFDIRFPINKYKKKYPGIKDKIPVPIEEDFGTSTVAGNKIIIKCNHCGNVLLKDLDSDEVKVEAQQHDPNAMDTYHLDNYRGFNETNPEFYNNTVHNDQNKVVSTPDTEETSKVKKRRLKYHVNKN